MQNDDSKRMNNVVYEREMSVGYSENTHLIEQSAYKYSLQEPTRTSTARCSTTTPCRRSRSTTASCP